MKQNFLVFFNVFEKKGNMKKINKRINLKLCLVFFVFLAGAGGAGYYFFNKYYSPETKIVKKATKYVVSVFGAVEKPGEYSFDIPMKIREIIFKAVVKTKADLSTLDLDKEINEDQEILVPFKIGEIEKIKWADLNNISQLTKYGVRKGAAQKIIDFRRKNLSTKWENIKTIKGIGPVTLNQLKDIIDLS